MRKWHKPQKDLREICRDEYGDDFVKMYDMVNEGIPIGNLEETEIFLAMVQEAAESFKRKDERIGETMNKLLLRLRKWWYCKVIFRGQCIDCPYHVSVWDGCILEGIDCGYKED